MAFYRVAFKFNVGNVLGMINKEVFAQFLYKLVSWTGKLFTLEKFWNYLLHVIWEKGLEKLKHFWPIANVLKIQVNRNNLRVYNVCFLICLFQLPSITLSQVISEIMLFVQCYSCIVIRLKLFLQRSNHILNSSQWCNLTFWVLAQLGKWSKTFWDF